MYVERASIAEMSVDEGGGGGGTLLIEKNEAGFMLAQRARIKVGRSMSEISIVDMVGLGKLLTDNKRIKKKQIKS